MQKKVPSRFVCVASAACLLAPVIPPAWAEPPSPSPKTDPALTDPSIEDVMREQLRRPKDVPPVEPNKAKPPQRAVPTYGTPSAKDAGLDAAALPRARFYPEGTLVNDRRGTIVHTEQGDVILVPEAPAGGDGDPLLVLLPCQRLSQITAARAATGPATRFIVGGQIFVYRDREFLLPTVFAVDHEMAAPTAAAPTPAAKDSGDPRVADLIRDLEASRSGPRRVTAAPQVAPVNAAGSEPPVGDAVVVNDPALKPEGTLLVSRRGRLVRIEELHGRLAFVLDNDPDSPAGKPLILQPCALLERMESVASTRGDSLVFRVSGRVTVNEGRNYLLPTFQQVVPPGDITPMQ